MFGTLILDAYTKEEPVELTAAIDDLCYLKDYYGYTSADLFFGELQLPTKHLIY